MSLRLAFLVLCLPAWGCAGESGSNDENVVHEEPTVTGGARALGAFPLCEASALVVSPNARHYWVADNEVHDRLFRFDTSGPFEDGHEISMSPGGRPQDIEALARIGNRLLIVGSHSGNGRPSQEKRHRMRWMTLEEDGGLQPDLEIPTPPEVWQTDESQCVQALFSGADQGRRICQAFREAGEIDIEGAAAVGDRIWLGLRAPLVNGRAILLRMANLREFKFDDVKLLDLDGAGVRALSASGGVLFGIAGPNPSARQPHHRLFRIRESDIEWRQTLPEGAEGLALVGDGAWVVFDGARGRRRCRHPARWLHIPVSGL